MATTYEMMLQMLGGVNPKSVNTMQDLSSYLFNPQYGITGNTFDPSYTLPAPYVPNTPRLDAYANSTNPLWRDTAMGIMNGSLDEASAVAALYNGLGFDYETEVKQGLSLDGIRSAVKEMFDEKERDVAARIKYDQDLLESEAGNIFGKAGLPQPYEEWTAETMPVSDPLRSFFSRLQTMENELSQKKKDIGGAEQLARLRLLAKRSASADADVADNEVDKIAIDLGRDRSAVVRGGPEKTATVRRGGGDPVVLRTRADILAEARGGESGDPVVLKTRSDIMKETQAEERSAKKREISEEEKRENAKLLNRAVQESIQSERDQYAQLERKLLQNKAVAANKLLGEKIALGIQGRTPLEEALRRRALGLQGM